MPTAQHVTHNHAFWERTSDGYQEQHVQTLSTSTPGWGVWQLPEAELQVLGTVAGKDVLEFGCGGAQWSICLTRQGARPVGLDFSGRQLRHATRLQRECGIAFPLVNASAENVPLRDAAFDIVFCDWGAMTFADPHRTVPEAARLLRSGGLLAFCTGTPIVECCWEADAEHPSERLVKDYFALHEQNDADGAVFFELPYGEWIRLFHDHGFAIESLLELQPPPEATSSYRSEQDREWARRWPMEQIWRVRRLG